MRKTKQPPQSDSEQADPLAVVERCGDAEPDTDEGQERRGDPLRERLAADGNRCRSQELQRKGR